VTDSTKPPRLYGPDNRPLPSNEDRGSTHTKHTAGPTPPKKAKSPAKRLHRRTLAISKVVISLLGICATLIGIWSVYPRVSVAPTGDTWNDHNPLSIPLTVSNNGIFEIYSAHLYCDVDYVWNFSHMVGIEDFNLTEPTDLPVGDLAGGGSTTTFCANPFNIMNAGDRVEARILLLLSFRPSFWPRQVSRPFYLQGKSDDKGKLHWIITSKFALRREHPHLPKK
jgi:hypothetical protein